MIYGFSKPSNHCLISKYSLSQFIHCFGSNNLENGIDCSSWHQHLRILLPSSKIIPILNNWNMVGTNEFSNPSTITSTFVTFQYFKQFLHSILHRWCSSTWHLFRNLWNYVHHFSNIMGIFFQQIIQFESFLASKFSVELFTSDVLKISRTDCWEKSHFSFVNLYCLLIPTWIRVLFLAHHLWATDLVTAEFLNTTTFIPGRFYFNHRNEMVVTLMIWERAHTSSFPFLDIFVEWIRPIS